MPRYCFPSSEALMTLKRGRDGGCRGEKEALVSPSWCVPGLQEDSTTSEDDGAGGAKKEQNAGAGNTL